MIEVENLSKSYGPRQAIRNLNFQVKPGEVVGFLGPNGAGKTTTMNILCCILPASEGTARINGFDIFENSLEIRKIIGYLPENPPLYLDMVVKDYLEFAAKIRLVPSGKVNAAVDRVLERCVLHEAKNRIIGKLSKGFKQRVGLAQAMIHDPDILVLDEPTSGLDPIQIIEIRNLIKELAESHTIVLSSHILPEVTQLCERVVIIHDGEIAAQDSLEGLTTSLRKNERLHLVVREGDGVVEKLESLPQVVSVRRENDHQFMIEAPLNSNLQDTIAQTVLDQQWGLVELKPVAMTLEDIFLKLTTEEEEVAE